MIILGYQGIGKSTLCKENERYIDLESGNTFVNGVRDEKWYKVYVNFAISLSEQGYVVFMSTHECVRKELYARGQRFLVIYPNVKIWGVWVEKLLSRWLQSDKEKDYKAYKNCEESLPDFYKAIERESKEHNELISYDIYNMNYNLSSIVAFYETADAMFRGVFCK